MNPKVRLLRWTFRSVKIIDNFGYSSLNRAKIIITKDSYNFTGVNMLNSLPILLVVEDDEGLHHQYKWAFKSIYQVYFAVDREQALTIFKQVNPGVVLLDLGLPPDESNATEGLAVLREMISLSPLTHVVVLTGSEQKQHALDAASAGAIDFQSKGISDSELKFALKRAFHMHALATENARLKNTPSFSESGIIGQSPSFIQSLKTARKVAPSPLTAMLLGESGVGKEVFANFIHQESNRKGEFVAINCASIPSELLESELFGHEKGAFTGAVQLKIGKIERANGGTLFLDEIGDMPVVLQAKLLRFLQEREIERIGGKKTFSVDVRVICATHQNLKEMVDKKTFREDLFYRLSEVAINIPSLRERGSDVNLLAKWFLQHYNREYQCSVDGFTDDAIAALNIHQWPGNVRELQNSIKSAVIMSESPLLSAQDLRINVSAAAIADRTIKRSVTSDYDGDITSLDEVRRIAESLAITRAYNQCNGNVTAAAKLLNITRPTFYAIANKYNLFTDKTN